MDNTPFMPMAEIKPNTQVLIAGIDEPMPWAAAQEINRLRAENERLRATLHDIAKVTYGWEPGVWSDEEARNYFASLFFGAQAKARTALKETNDVEV